MALVVEDGTGLANADSYASVAEADAYAVSFGRTEWTPLAVTTVKEVRLRKATQYIDLMWQWPSRPLLATQGLAFPRLVLFLDGTRITGVPKNVVKACCELASYPGLPDLNPTPEEQKYLSLTRDLGGVKKTEVFRNRPLRKQFSVANGMLAPLMGSSLTSGMSYGRLRPQ
jgi:hypothetical protein